MSPVLIETFQSSGDGPSVAVKDCIDIAGSPTCCGSRALADAPPAPSHAAVVQALVDGGWNVVAKASMHELAYGMTGINHWTGPVANPLFPGLIPGGSSSGSAAAVAAGLVDVALGTDTGGSVRMPAACCGVLGFKPSFGRLSRQGVHPAESRLDCVGVLARSPHLIERAMAQMDMSFQSFDAGDGFSIGLVGTDADPEILSAIAAALEGCSGTVQALDLPGLEDAFQAGVVEMAAEALTAYGHLVDGGLLGEDVEQRLRRAPKVATADRRRWAQDVRVSFTAAVDFLLEQVDVLALPTLPAFPPRIDAVGDPAAILHLSSLVRPFNLSGHPAISLPVPTASGRPAALQLVARHGDDPRLCAIARQIMTTTPITQHEDII